MALVYSPSKTTAGTRDQSMSYRALCASALVGCMVFVLSVSSLHLSLSRLVVSQEKTPTAPATGFVRRQLYVLTQEQRRMQQIREEHFSAAWGDLVPVTVGHPRDVWRRTYARSEHCAPDDFKGNATHVVAAPLNKTDGVAAGPMIDCQGKADKECNARECMWDLHAYRSLLKGTGMQFQLPSIDPTDNNGKLTVLFDRIRYSSASAICFLSDRHLAAASFAKKTLYLYEFDITSRTATLLDTAEGGGNLDLMHCDTQRQLIATSILSQRAADIFWYDLNEKKLTKQNHVRIFPERLYRNDFVHDVALHPTVDDVLVSATMRHRWSCPDKFLRVYNYRSQHVLGDFNLTSNPFTRGFLIRGLRFIDDRHILAATFLGGRETVKNTCTIVEQVPTLEARIFLFRLEFDLDLDVNGNLAGGRKAATQQQFTLVDWLSVPNSNVEGLDFHKGLAIAADQMSDRHLVFHVDIAAERPLQMLGTFKGCHISHGVGLNRDWDLLGLTCYGDNSVWVHKLSDALDIAGIAVPGDVYK